MKHPRIWWSVIVLLVAWSIYNVYPPRNQDLINYFVDHAVRPNKVFNEIVSTARKLQQEHPGVAREFENLKEAIGTNDIKYFSLILTSTRRPTRRMPF